MSRAALYIDAHGRKCRLVKYRSGFIWAWLKPINGDAGFRISWDDLRKLERA